MCQKCGLLVEVEFCVHSVCTSVCRSVEPLVISMHLGTTADWTEMPFRVVGRMGPGNNVLDFGKGGLGVFGAHWLIIIYFAPEQNNTNSKYSVRYMNNTDKAPKEQLLSPRGKN